eukprot:XP_014774127.1 PREDICTED: perlucin-like [Octopus bimaculoides]
MIIFSMLLFQICLGSNVDFRECYGTRIHPSVTGIPEDDKLIQISNIRSQIQCLSQCMIHSKCTMIIYSVSYKVCILRKIKQLPVASSFIEIPPNSIYTILQAPECPISAGYIYQPEFRLCFRLSLEKKTWNQAADDCNMNRGQLMHAENEEIMKYLQTVLEKWPNDNFYFGLCKDIKKGVFLWQNGEAPTYDFWRASRPDNYGGNQHCVRLDPKSNHEWNDHPCDRDSERYICEIVM